MSQRDQESSSLGGEQTIVDAAVNAAEKPGTRVGRYKIRELIGEGGCGAVYVADQEEPVRRRVALKVIKLGMDTRSVIARFEAERQALAMMDHPNIAKVLDAGATETGRPFFVMELVRGIRITEYCDQNNLSTVDRLDLFIKVCQAVQHAHQKGIIHRDLKPSNILVTLHDGVPVPKVIDFGISKATEGRLTDLTIYTELHQFIGTPAYLSPEQAEMSGLDIDTRSDIYSLGVLLYELLTGRTPFDGKELMESGIDQMRRTIREKEPARPSTKLSTMVASELTTAAKRRQCDAPKLINLLRGDLDWIVMKALEKDRTRRYETANGLAADLQRYLRNEAVTARPPSAGYRFQKAFRRNRTAFTAAGAVALALTAGAVLSSMQAFRARQAEKLATARLHEAEQARQKSEEVSKFLQQVFQSPNPERDGRSVTVAETLDRAAKELETELKDQPDRRARLASTLAATYNALGLYKSSIPLQEEVYASLRQKNGVESSDCIDLMQDLGDSYQAVGRAGDALKLRELVLPATRKINGPEHPKSQRALYALTLSYSTDPKRKDEVLKMREEVLAARRKVLGPEHPDTIRSMIGVSVALGGIGRPNEANRLDEETLALSRRALGPTHPKTLMVLNNLSISYAESGRWSDAIRVQEELLDSNRKINGPEHPRTLTGMGNLANSYLNAERLTNAVALQEQVVEISRKNTGPESVDTARFMARLGVIYYRLGRTNDAIKLQENLVGIYRRAFGPDDVKTLLAKSTLGGYCVNSGKGEEGLKLFEEAVTDARRLKGATDPVTLGILEGLAKAYNVLTRTNEETQLREELVFGTRKQYGADGLENIAQLSSLADCYSVSGRMADAIRCRKEILRLREMFNGSLHYYTIDAVLKLERAYLQAGKTEEGRKLLGSLSARGIKQWLVLAPIPFEKGRHTFALTNDFLGDESRTRPRANARMKINGREFMWRGIESQDSVLDFNEVVGKQTEWAVAYAVSYLQSERTQGGLTMFISSDDQAKVYLNGKEIYRADKTRTLWQGRDRVDGVELHAGVNVLLLKVVNCEGGWQANVNLLTESGEPVTGVRAALGPEKKGEIFSEKEVPNPFSGSWNDVKKALARNIELFPEAHSDWCHLAPLLLQLGDTAAYEKHRHGMLARFEPESPFVYKERTAKACLLRPLEGEDLKTAAKLAEDAYREGNSSPLVMWFAFAKSLAEYRSGNFPEAAELARRVTAESEEHPDRNAEAHFVLAMANHRLKKREEAQRALSEGMEITQTKLPKIEKPTAHDETWSDIMIANILMREAKALIERGAVL